MHTNLRADALVHRPASSDGNCRASAPLAGHCSEIWQPVRPPYTSAHQIRAASTLPHLSWQAPESPLDDKRILVLDGDPGPPCHRDFGEGSHGVSVADSGAIVGRAPRLLGLIGGIDRGSVRRKLEPTISKYAPGSNSQGPKKKTNH